MNQIIQLPSNRETFTQFGVAYTKDNTSNKPTNIVSRDGIESFYELNPDFDNKKPGNGGTAGSEITPISLGGTGKTTAKEAINALIPSQVGNKTKVLTTDGNNVAWGEMATATAPASSSANFYRQAIINGNFDIWQRSAGGTSNPANNTYTADRWKVRFNHSGVLPNLQHNKNTEVINAVIKGSSSLHSYELGLDVAATGTAPSDFYMISQFIENGTSLLCGYGKKFTVSFWAYCFSDVKIGVYAEQNYGTGGSPTDALIGTTFVLQATIKRKCTFTFDTLDFITSPRTFPPGGEHDDSLAINLVFLWGGGGGGTVSALVNSAGVAQDFAGGGLYYISEFQVCAGDKDLDFMPRSFGEELELCKRYYQKSYATDQAPGTATFFGTLFIGVGTNTTNILGTVCNLGVSMARAPNITLFDDVGNSGVCWRSGSNRAAAAGNVSNSAFRVFSQDTTSSNTANWHWTAEAEF